MNRTDLSESEQKFFAMTKNWSAAKLWVFNMLAALLNGAVWGALVFVFGSLLYSATKSAETTIISIACFAGAGMAQEKFAKRWALAKRLRAGGSGEAPGTSSAV